MSFSLKVDAWSDHGTSVKPDSLSLEFQTNKTPQPTHTLYIYPDRLTRRVNAWAHRLTPLCSPSFNSDKFKLKPITFIETVSVRLNSVGSIQL